MGKETSQVEPVTQKTQMSMLQWTYTQTLDDMSESIQKVENREWYEPMVGCNAQCSHIS